MNTSQMNCFLAAAECLNFTKAAERMHLSQPGLSRQISAMERELGVELFERGKSPVRLTAAGAICVEHFSRITEDFQKMLNQLTMAQRLEQGSIIIGAIEGQLVGLCYENVLNYVWSTRPNVKIKMSYYSISDLCKALVEGELDIAIMPEAEAERLPGVAFTRSHMEKCCLIVPSSHSKANAENPTLQDFKDEIFLVLAESDSEVLAKQHMEICQAAGFTPKQHVVPTVGTLTMLLEMGAGITVLDAWHTLRNASHVKFLQVPDIGYQIEAAAWREDNANPYIQVFIERIKHDYEEPQAESKLPE